MLELVFVWFLKIGWRFARLIDKKRLQSSRAIYVLNDCIGRFSINDYASNERFLSAFRFIFFVVLLAKNDPCIVLFADSSLFSSSKTPASAYLVLLLS